MGALLRPLYHQYDWNFHNMIGCIVRLDGSVKDDNHKPTMLLLLIKVAHESYLEVVGVFELYSMCELPKNWMPCLEHELSCEFYTSV